MKSLTINYNPVPLLPFFLTVTRTIPESWSEVTEKQLAAFEKLAAGRISVVRFIANMFGVSPWLVRRFSEFENFCIVEYLDFMKHPEGYLQQSAHFGRAATIAPDELHSPVYYCIEQIQSKKKND